MPLCPPPELTESSLNVRNQHFTFQSSAKTVGLVERPEVSGSVASLYFACRRVTTSLALGSGQPHDFST